MIVFVFGSEGFGGSRLASHELNQIASEDVWKSVNLDVWVGEEGENVMISI
jgi:hypothetical protein